MITLAVSPSARSTTSTKKHQQPRLRVVVADDHHHVLPEIHLAIRRRVLPFQGVHIVHFDAHPDLSFSSVVDAALVFEPERLYDALDESPSGIAEFLLPLVAAGHVDRITWIKSPWAKQMQVGDAMQRIALGRRSCSSDSKETQKTPARLAVACAWPHFIDDELYAPADAMDAASIKLFDLAVEELPVAVSTSAPWVLDVDLDFFSTWNPFRKDLEASFDADIVALLTEIFTLPRYRNTASTLTPEQRIYERRQFLDTMARVEHEKLYQAPTSAATQDAFQSLASLYPDTSDALTGLSRFAAFLRTVESDDELLALVWNAAPCLDLPHHESCNAELEHSFDQFKAFIASTDSPPSLVTIATSVSDRFLPPHQLETVRTRVLKTLEEVLGPLQVDEIEYEPASE